MRFIVAFHICSCDDYWQWSFWFLYPMHIGVCMCVLYCKILIDLLSLLQKDPEPVLDIIINNVVSSFSVACHLDLHHLALHGNNVELRKENGVSIVYQAVWLHSVACIAPDWTFIADVLSASLLCYCVFRIYSDSGYSSIMSLNKPKPPFCHQHCVNIMLVWCWSTAGASPKCCLWSADS